MKKMIIGIVLGLSLVANVGMACKIMNYYNYETAKELVQELKKSDNDGDGHFTQISRHGLLGYEVTFFRSWHDEVPELYVIGF